MIKKKSVCLIIFFVLLYCSPVFASEETLITNHMNALGLEDVDRQFEQFENNSIEYSFQKTMEGVINGTMDISPNGILKKVLHLLFGEINSQFYLIEKLLIIVILSAILKNLNGSFRGKSVGELSFYVCYMVLIILVVSFFQSQLQMVSGTIGDMVIGLQAMIPVFMTILASSGNIGEATVIGPAIMGAAGILSSIVQSLVLPAVAVVTILEMVNYLSEREFLTQFSALLKGGISWSLKGIAIIFMTVVSIQKIAVPALNTALGKTAKAAVGSIPVVGDVMSGAVETAAALSGLLKSGAATAAVIFFIIMALLPIIKLIAMILIYKLTAAIAEPVCEERLVKCISAAGDFSLLLLSALFIVEIMFLFSVIILLGIV